MVGDLLALANVILAGLVVFYSLKRHPNYGTGWIKWSRVIVSAYWFGLYLFVLLQSPTGYNTALFGQVFVRPAFTVTLAVMAVGAIQRYRTNKQ